MSSENNGKVWFITGASRGFGLLWATAALERGDRVAVTTRNAAALEHLSQKYGDAVLPLSLDVTDRKATFAAVNLANQHFGRLDIVLNNAGYGHQGTVEEASEEEARADGNQLFRRALDHPGGIACFQSAGLWSPAGGLQRARRLFCADFRYLQCLQICC